MTLIEKLKEVQEALKHLVHLKDYKDHFGKDEPYEASKPAAWKEAREALSLFPSVLEEVEGMGWKDIETAPKNGTPITVGHLARFKPYKPQARKQGYPEGRWQEWNGYGWQNIDWEPTEWQPAEETASKL